MLVKVTYPMIKLLKENIKGYEFSMMKFTPNNYNMNVDYSADATSPDYSRKTGKFSVIRVDYPAEYYAMPRYLTTKDLSKAFRGSDKTLAGFINAVKDDIAI